MKWKLGLGTIPFRNQFHRFRHRNGGIDSSDSATEMVESIPPIPPQRWWNRFHSMESIPWHIDSIPRTDTLHARCNFFIFIIILNVKVWYLDALPLDPKFAAIWFVDSLWRHERVASAVRGEVRGIGQRRNRFRNVMLFNFFEVLTTYHINTSLKKRNEKYIKMWVQFFL